MEWLWGYRAITMLRKMRGGSSILCYDGWVDEWGDLDSRVCYEVALWDYWSGMGLF